MADSDSHRQVIELFHLEFLRLLCVGPDKAAFALKGGCNLRFFFGSVRYSEDMDLDVTRIPRHVLKGKVEKILDSTALKMRLQSRSITVGPWSAPKQTDTTQRWKVQLGVANRALGLHTKIELSRRASNEEANVEPVTTEILAEHKLMPLLVPHYSLAPALRQKVLALVGRREVQARDVFDLNVLLAKAGTDLMALKPIRNKLDAAGKRALELTFDAYQAQVVSYLKPEHIDAFGTREAWEAMQLRVVEALEQAAR